jgi:hypothetical protein
VLLISALSETSLMIIIRLSVSLSL